MRRGNVAEGRRAAAARGQPALIRNGEAGEDGGHLGAGDRSVRPEGAVGVALEHAGRCQRGDGPRIPAAERHVGEAGAERGIARAALLRQQPIEDHGRLGAGDLRVRAERAVRIALDVGAVIRVVQHGPGGGLRFVPDEDGQHHVTGVEDLAFELDAECRIEPCRAVVDILLVIRRRDLPRHGERPGFGAGVGVFILERRNGHRAARGAGIPRERDQAGEAVQQLPEQRLQREALLQRVQNCFEIKPARKQTLDGLEQVQLVGERIFERVEDLVQIEVLFDERPDGLAQVELALDSRSECLYDGGRVQVDSQRVLDGLHDVGKALRAIQRVPERLDPFRLLREQSLPQDSFSHRHNRKCPLPCRRFPHT